MGITGLLPFLKTIQRDVHISSFKGMSVAVDAYCWLHKGAYSCATQIVMKTADVETLPLINYCLRRVNLLRQHDITPIMVFDGCHLPTKANTEKERRERRQSYLSKGKELLKQGKKSEAHDCFQKSVDISPEIALAFIKECRKLGVQYIVAPYEADAQLAYLSKENIVDLVVTEDSDLLVFGSKKVLFKLDETGNGKLVELKDLGKANKNLIGFTPDSFRQMCILSGCDYLPSVPGIGLGKATKFMRKYHFNPTQVIRALRCENSKVPNNYESNFKKAEWTFLYQLVFDPRSQTQVRLNKLPDDLDPKEFEFAGVEQSPKKAVHMARGNINPITFKTMDTYTPTKAPPIQTSSWSCSVMGSSNKQYPITIQAKLPISSSAKASKPFKPPSKSHQALKKPSEDGVLRDRELMNIYSDSQAEEDSTETGPSQRTLSKYFADQATEECDSLPTDNSTDLLESRDHHSPIPMEVASTSSNVCIRPSLVRKRLFESGNDKLNRFAFIKRQRTTSNSGSSNSNSSNPFSVMRQKETRLPPVNSLDMEESTAVEDETIAASPDEGCVTDEDDDTPSFPITGNSSGVCDDDDDDSGCDGEASLRDVSNQLFQQRTDGARPRESFSSSALLLDHQQLQEEEGELERQEESKGALCAEEVEVVESKSTASSKWNHSVKSTPINSISSNRNSHSKLRRPNSCGRVGLSKKTKPARLSEPGPRQLSIFSYMKKPQMKL